MAFYLVVLNKKCIFVKKILWQQQNGEVGWLVNDMIGSNYLNDIFDDKVMNDLPTDYGVYSAELCVESYSSNAPQDPEEWDMNMWLENIKIEMKL